ncbi:hypothetical protein CMI38_01060 [Candidatus Pacearchaeota archaeon]|jgi:hypothetical protein|nr:hypothetical protein [Candidatus Pacearchaeota archaeon]|tara:strand:+ start:576 stop:1130 length:555 start_codon:yes stop_codon:yes gene_type:complete
MKKIESVGWFDASDLYTRMVKEFPKGHFVEIGAWMGRSTKFMGKLIKDTEIVFDVVDHFKGNLDHSYQQEIVKLYGGCIYKQFKRNMEKENCWAEINQVHVEYSSDAVNHYKNESLDFVYIDASHDYPSVYADIKGWIKKVKKGGVIAGDDYDNCPGVKRAVDIFFKDKEISFSGTHTWEYYKW